MNRLRSIKVRLGLVIVAGVVVSDVAALTAVRFGLPVELAALGAAALALALVQLLARGLTRPLREMARASRAMAEGQPGLQVSAGDRADEVGELARAFNAMSARLAQTDRQRRDLVANVSHELRTPLGALQARLENVADGVEPADAETVATMLAQVRRLTRLVEQLLDLSRLEGQDQPFEARPFAVDEVLEAVAREARLPGGDAVELAVAAPPGLVARGDAERVHQVVMNLVENAVRHSPRPGRVEIAAEAAPGGVRIAVSDRGPGIPEADAGRVFERFYRADRARSGDGPAWGWPSPAGSSTCTAGGSTPRRPSRTAAAWCGDGVVSAFAGGPERPASAQPPAPPLPPRVAALAVLAGLLAAVGLAGQRPGLNVVVVAVALAAAAVASRRVAGDAVTWGLSMTALALAFTAVLRDAAWVVIPSLAVAVGLGSLAVSGGRSWPGVVRGLAAGPARLWPGGVGVARAVTAPVAARPRDALWPVVRGVGLGACLVVVFGLLFASGDAAFHQLATSALPAADDLGPAARRGLWFAVVAALAGGLAAGAAAARGVTARAAAIGLGPTEWTIALTALNCLFAAFAAVQALVFFGGHDHVLQTGGLTYAEYARRGFAQLVAAAGLTLVVVAGALRWSRTPTPGQHRRLRVALVVLCGLTLVVLASAMARLDLYQEVLGATRLRLAVQASMGWIAGVLVLVGAAVALARDAWLPRAAMLFSGLALLAFGLSDPDLRIAERNLERQRETGRLDVEYLRGLSADAVPALVGLPGQPRSTVLAGQRARLADDDGPFAANRARARARRLLRR